MDDILDLDKFRRKVKKESHADVRFDYEHTEEFTFNLHGTVAAELDNCQTFLEVNSWGKVIGIAITVIQIWRCNANKGWKLALVRDGEVKELLKAP